MKPTTKFLVGLAMTVGLLVATATTAGAFADVDEYDLTCSTFAATGTINQPYVDIYVLDVGPGGDDLFWDRFPTNGQTFEVSVSWEAVPEGTPIFVAVSGAPENFPGSWDEEAIWEIEVDCTNAEPDPEPPVVPLDPVEPAEAVVEAPRFTG